MTAYSDIAKKMRRAFRNESGTKFSLDELRAIADIGAFDAILHAEAEEIKGTWAKTHRPASLESTGSTSGGMVNLPTSGRSPDMTPNLGRTFIAALSAKH